MEAGSYIDQERLFDSPEAFAKGQEVLDNLRVSREQIEDIIRNNPGIDLDSIRVLIDNSLDLEIVPAQPILRTIRRIERPPHSMVREYSAEPFVLVLASAVPQIESDGIGLRMLGNSLISPDGLFYSYDFNPLAGHELRALRARDPIRYQAYRSGLAVVMGSSSSAHTFVIY